MVMCHADGSCYPAFTILFYVSQPSYSILFFNQPVIMSSITGVTLKNPENAPKWSRQCKMNSIFKGALLFLMRSLASKHKLDYMVHVLFSTVVLFYIFLVVLNGLMLNFYILKNIDNFSIQFFVFQEIKWTLGLNDIYEKHGRRPQPWLYWRMFNVTKLAYRDSCYIITLIFQCRSKESLVRAQLQTRKIY